MVIVGLTGGIGAGKSTAAAWFQSRGAVVIDVDALGHVVLAVGGRAHDAVRAAFGTVDRAALGPIVFGDPEQLARLTAISHPAINEELRERLATITADVVVLDMAILAESNLGRGMYTTVVTVEAPEELRVQRAVARGMREDDVRRRVAAQASEAQRRALADHVVVNDGDAAALAVALEQVWDQLEI